MKNTVRPAQLRKQRIVLCALECFCKSGIQATTITQIASVAQVGEATIYRYFTNKPELVFTAANIVWEHMLVIYNRKVSNANIQQMSGIDHLALFLDVPIVLFEEKPVYLKFIYDFDRYINRLAQAQSQIGQNNENIRSLKKQFYDIFEKGQLDGSINKTYKQEEILWLMISTLFSLTDKLFQGSQNCQANIEDSNIEESKKQLQAARDIMINGLRPLEQHTLFIQQKAR